MNLIWRFYLDPNQLWRWQHLAFNQTVVAQSRKGYNEYEHCLKNAQAHGYIFLPSQTARATVRNDVRTRW
jgi:hypothetical protein